MYVPDQRVAFGTSGNRGSSLTNSLNENHILLLRKPFVFTAKNRKLTVGNIIDMNLIRDSKISVGVDPLGGAGVRYWEPIADCYKLNLKVVSKMVDPTFSFMTVDW